MAVRKIERGHYFEDFELAIFSSMRPDEVLGDGCQSRARDV